jgi:transcriptional regulator with XRE-family HTH domain
MSHEPHIDPYKSLAHYFAYELRRSREAEGLSQNELAAEIHTTRACISAYETCTRRPGKEFAQSADKRLGTEDRLTIIHHHSRREHGSRWFEDYLGYEKQAFEVKTFQQQVVHGLLQSDGYARATLKLAHPKDLEGAVARRLSRQAVLSREDPAAPHLWAVFDETVLVRGVRDRAAMREQLSHLLAEGDRPNVTIQVVPFSVGEYWGIRGEMTILGLPEGDVAYTEAHLGGRLIEDPAEVRTLEVRFDLIRAKALSDDATRDLIARRLKEL